MEQDELKRIALALAVVSCPNCLGTLQIKDASTDQTNVRCIKCFIDIRFLFQDHEESDILSISRSDYDRLMGQNLRMPPMILYYKWETENPSLTWERADFYPFIPVCFLLSPQTPVSLMSQSDTLVFSRFEVLPHYTIYNSPDEDDLAEIASTWDKISMSIIQSRFNMGYLHSSRIKEKAEEIRQKKGLPVADSDDDSDD